MMYHYVTKYEAFIDICQFYDCQNGKEQKHSVQILFQIIKKKWFQNKSREYSQKKETNK